MNVGRYFKFYVDGKNFCCIKYLLIICKFFLYFDFYFINYGWGYSKFCDVW